MKRVVSLVLTIALLSAMCATVSATSEPSTTKVLKARENVDSFLAIIDSENAPDEYAFLYDFTGIIKAVIYQLSDGGYIVADYNDGHIIEYSPDDLAESPVEISKKQIVYYGGPLLFYIMLDGVFENIITGETFGTQETINTTAMEKAQLRTVPDDACRIYQTRETSLLSAPSHYISSAGSYCTITGITNLLLYYKDYYSADVYCGSVSGTYGLRNALNDGYIYSGPLYLSSAATSHTESGVTYLGLSSYLSRNDVTNYDVTVTSLTCSMVKTQIGTYTRPVLLTIDTALIDPNSNTLHIVLCYGYWETSMTTYYIVNNGWGSNSVYICADDVPSSYEMLYLHQ